MPDSKDGSVGDCAVMNSAATEELGSGELPYGGRLVRVEEVIEHEEDSREGRLGLVASCCGRSGQ